MINPTIHLRSRTSRRRAWRKVCVGLEEMEPRVVLSSATFAVTSDWGTGFGGQITIANTQATAVSNWTLSFNWDRVDHRHLGRHDRESCRTSLCD